MEYLIMSQDNRWGDVIEPIGVPRTNKGELIKESPVYQDEIPPVQYYIKEKKQNNIIDLLERPIPLISDKLKTILMTLEKSIVFSPVVLADLKLGTQFLYWHMEPQSIECLSPETEFNKNGTIKKLVIDAKKASGYRVFRVKNTIENFTIINLIVAESILRRGFTGIKMIKIIGGEQ